jgi:hypothetical protein
MLLEIQRGKSSWWYGRVEANGKYYSKNLGVEVRGRIPASLKELGDPCRGIVRRAPGTSPRA